MGLKCMPSHISKPLKLASLKKIRNIWKKYPNKKNFGIDRVTCEKFTQSLELNFSQIHKELINGNYKFSNLRFWSIPKEGDKDRIICIPTIRDRLTQRLILDALIYPNDRLGIKNQISFGSICGNGGVHKALSSSVKKRNIKKWVLKTDISSFFDNINRSDLINLLDKKLKKFSFLPFIKQVISCEVEVKNEENQKILERNGVIKGKGLRQGMPLSPILANFILQRFDCAMKRRSIDIVRYMDDIAVFCDSEKECFDALKLISQELEKVKQVLPSIFDCESKTKIISPGQPLIFLGIEIYEYSDGLYSIKIPQSTITRIMDDLQKYKDLKYVLNQRLNYLTLSKLIERKYFGYRAAFKDTSNINSFLDRYEDMKIEIKEVLLKSILGSDLFFSLDKEKRNFLGLN